MYVVTNRIDVKKGFAEKMASKFTQGGKIQELEGFQKLKFGLLMMKQITIKCISILGGILKMTLKVG